MPCVILVNDDRGVVRLLTNILATRANVVNVPNSNDVLTIVEQNQPQVIIVDLDLPGSSGLQCIARLKKHYPSISLIVFTAHNQLANVVLDKTIVHFDRTNPDVLISHIESVLDTDT